MKFLDNLTKNAGGLGLVGGLISSIYNIFQNERNRKKMAESEKQRMDYQDELNDDNADEAYRKQREFQNDFLTPEAQIKSQAAGYAAVGLNKMGLAGTSPGASASTAPESSASQSSPVSGEMGAMSPLMDALGLGLQEKKMKQDYEISKRQLDIQNKIADADISLKIAQAAGQNIDNETRAAMNLARLDNIKENTNLLREKVLTEPVQRALMQSGISKNEAEAALAVNEAALAEIESKHKDEWLRLQNELASLNAEAQRINNRYAEPILATKIRVMNAEIEKMQADAVLTVLESNGQKLTNGILAKDFQKYDGAYKREVAQSWIKSIGTVVGAAAGAAVGFGKLRAPAAVLRSSPFGYSPADAYNLNPYMMNPSYSTPRP